uniref:Uncharacterized protein n=1 Tax=Arundo donax TaxID=35708 RepID=A0A0A9D5W7_ARUDO
MDWIEGASFLQRDCMGSEDPCNLTRSLIIKNQSIFSPGESMMAGVLAEIGRGL